MEQGTWINGVCTDTTIGFANITLAIKHVSEVANPILQMHKARGIQTHIRVKHEIGGLTPDQVVQLETMLEQAVPQR